MPRWPNKTTQTAPKRAAKRSQDSAAESIHEEPQCATPNSSMPLLSDAEREMESVCDSRDDAHDLLIREMRYHELRAKELRYFLAQNGHRLSS